MEMRDWEELKKKLCHTVDEMKQRKNFDRADIDVIDKLVHSIEKIDKIMMAEGGSSYAGYRNSYGPMPEYSNRNGMWSAEGSYANDDSYGRSGTHFVNSHYSRDGEMMPDRRMY